MPQMPQNSILEHKENRVQRSATKNTRGANAAEKRFMDFCKSEPCIICFQPPPSIVDHMYGSTFRHNKVLIGPWAELPYCPECDEIKTQGSHRTHFKVFGFTQASLWLRFIERYPARDEIPEDVIASIKSWNR